MFVIGIVVSIDETSTRVKLQIPEMDNFETGWFFVPQLCTVGDKSHNQIQVKTLVGACCSEDLQDGCIIGALYNDEDVCILSGENVKYIYFEDGTKIIYDKLKNELNFDCVGNITIKALKTTINSDIEIVGNIQQTGNLQQTGTINITGNVTTEADIIANGISLAQHTHGNGNSGANTTGPQ